MYKRVFKQKGSRVYRVRYRLSDGPKIYDVPLRTHIKEVAEAKARRLIEEQERELAGLAAPKIVREAAQRRFRDHVGDFVAELKARGRNRGHVRHTGDRLRRLAKDCGWNLLRDATADGFAKWRTGLAHANALFNWLIRNGRAAHNPLKSLLKLPKAPTFERRALSFEEFVRFLRGSDKRRLAYFVASCTGLRRGEMKQLLWSDLDLNDETPCIVLRPETTKNKKGGCIPLVPLLADLLRQKKAEGMAFSGRVFPRGIPSVKVLTKDLAACGIPVEDERGYRVDFHALRHTFVSLLAHVKVSELVRVKLARHGDWKQTDNYTDEKSIPLGDGIAQLAAALPSSLASPNSGKTCPKLGNSVQADTLEPMAEVVPITSKSAHLAKAVPSWESVELVPKGGLEPPCG